MQDISRKLQDYYALHKEDIVKDIERLVAAQSPSRNKIYADRCADELIDIVRERINLLPEIIDQEETGKNLAYTYGEKTESKVIVIGHYDTVWDIDAIPMVVEKAVLKGPGVYDMKTGVVSSIWAVKAIQDLDIEIPHQIILFFNSDEEIGSIYSRPYIKEYATGCKAAFITEPSEGKTGNIKFETKRQWLENKLW